MSVEPEVILSMQLANAPTSARYCYAAADILGTEVSEENQKELDNDGEFVSEIVDEYDSALFAAGYYVWWDCGDVVVWDLRNLSESEREDLMNGDFGDDERGDSDTGWACRFGKRILYGSPQGFIGSVRYDSIEEAEDMMCEFAGYDDEESEES